MKLTTISLLKLGNGSIVIGVIFFLWHAFSPVYVDTAGVLHEPLFYLIPMGYLFLFIGMSLIASSIAKRLWHKQFANG